jgi:tripartite-type tricarboxylate transporter receptor subunit TctC
MLTLIRICLVATVAYLCAPAVAQTYPDRPVRFLVVNPPGGGVDLIARLLAKPLSEHWNQPVVVENKTGASGMLAAAAVAAAAADGYTLLMSASDMALNAALFPKMQYDPIKAFAPVTLVATTPLVLVSHPSLRSRGIRELVEYLSARPGKLNYSSGGNGTPQHFAGELFRVMSKVDVVHVPYKSGGLQVVGLVAGEVAYGFAALLPALPHIKAGRLDALGVSALERSPALRTVLTLAEAGFAGFEIIQWYATWAPAGTPKTVVERIGSSIAGIAESPDFKQRMFDLGAEVRTTNPQELRELQVREIAKYRQIATHANIRID